jgi:uncharacterized membrane protein YtjA (UPF0391 family)
VNRLGLDSSLSDLVHGPLAPVRRLGLKKHTHFDREVCRPGRVVRLVRYAHSLVDHRGGAMLYGALMFLVIAVMAGLLGFGFIAFVAAGVAQIVFFLSLTSFFITLIKGWPNRA